MKYYNFRMSKTIIQNLAKKWHEEKREQEKERGRVWEREKEKDYDTAFFQKSTRYYKLESFTQLDPHMIWSLLA